MNSHFFNYTNGVYDNSPIYLLTCIGFYCLFSKIPLNKTAGKILESVGKHTFGIYMVHWFVLFRVTKKLLPMDGANLIVWIAGVMFTAAIGFAVTFICDNFILNPVTKRLLNSSKTVRVISVVLILICFAAVPLLSFAMPPA